MSKSGVTWNFTYDADGLRTKRTDGINTYLYYYEDGLLRCMEYNGVKMFFTYDAQGMPVSMTYNGATYYYALNLQGDVMAILNASSAAVVNYNYTAWGELLSTTGSLANTIGLYNPLRYRGYVYDRETGLYYLQSRYYDPEIGRFISPDNQLTGSVLGNNMYAYCINNPTNYSDITGHSPSAEAMQNMQWWAAWLGWLPFADAFLPVGDIFYNGGLLIGASLVIESDTADIISSSIAEIGSHVSNSKKKKSKNKGSTNPTPPDVNFPKTDPAESPGDGFEWRGKLPKGGDKGAWVNNATGEQWHPDLNHPYPKGPHWDYTDIWGNVWSVFKDGRVVIWE